MIINVQVKIVKIVFHQCLRDSTFIQVSLSDLQRRKKKIQLIY